MADKSDNPGIVTTNPDPTLNVRELVVAANLRSDDLREAEARRVNEILALDRDHQRELREAEAKRIDAIRAVDVAAVGRATEQASATAALIATQVTTTAETIRSQLATTTSQLLDRIGQLERTSYEGSGKSSVADPQLAQLIVEMREARTARDRGEGRTAVSTPLLIGIAGGAAGLIVFVLDTLLRVPALH